jgi:predicted permease
MSIPFNQFLTVIATIFFLLAVGYIIQKIGIVDDVSSNRLSKLIVGIAQPMLIFSSLIGMEYSSETAKMGFRMLIIGLAVHAFMSIFAFFSCKWIRELDERKITEFAMVMGNCGFIGFPIFESLFGDTGLFLGAFFIISFQITLWSWGVMILARKRDDIKISLKKILINKGTVPSLIGIIFFFLNIPLPEFITSGCDYVASLCTPISVLITGALIATKPLKQFFTLPKLYYLSFMKLIVLPLLVCAVMSLLNFDADTIVFCTVAAAMPSAAVASMFGTIYSIKPSYASQAVGFTTLLSVGTMPLVMLIVPKIIEIL